MEPISPVIGSFYQKGAFHIFHASSFKNINGDPLLKVSPSCLKRMRTLFSIIFNTVSTDPVCLRNQKLQQILYLPSTSFDLKENSIILKGADHQEWDLSNIPAQKITTSASGKFVETLCTHGIFIETLGSLALKTLQNTEDEKDSEQKDPSETSAMDVPAYYGEPLPSANDLVSFLPFLRSWCVEDACPNPDGRRAIAVFEQKIQEDFLASLKQPNPLLPKEFIKKEVLAIFNEIENKYLSSENREALSFLKENSRLEKKIFQKWKEILHPSLFYPFSIRYITNFSSQNIALAALVSTAFYCFSSTASAVAFFAGFLVHSHISDIDNKLHKVKPLSYLHPTFRKVTTIALIGIVASSLCSRISPTILATFFGIYYFGIERCHLIPSFAEKISPSHSTITTSCLVLIATAFCSGYVPIVSLGSIATSIVVFKNTKVLLQPCRHFPYFKKVLEHFSSTSEKIFLSLLSGSLMYMSGKYLLPTFIEATFSNYSKLIFCAFDYTLFPIVDKISALTSYYLIPTSWWGRILLFPSAIICKQWIKEKARRISFPYQKILPASEKSSWLITTLLWGIIFSLGRSTFSFFTIDSKR